MNPSNKIIVSIVLGSYNRRAFLKQTLDSIRNNGIEASYEIIVIDGGSTDGSLKYLLRQKDVITIVQHNRGNFRGKPIERRSWGYFMNLGFKSAQGKYILMISDDSLLVPNAVQNGVQRFEDLLKQGKKIAAMAFYWRDWPDYKEYRVGFTLGGKMFVNHGLYLRQAIIDVNYIDEERYAFYHADGDLCLKFWHKGYEVTDSPNSYVEHFAHANIKIRKNNLNTQKKDWQNYLKKWEGIYEPSNSSAKDWEYIKYKDTTNTIRFFPKLPVWKRRLRTLAVRIKKYLEKKFKQTR